jgi:hypothetical protein
MNGAFVCDVEETLPLFVVQRSMKLNFSFDAIEYASGGLAIVAIRGIDFPVP